MMKCFVSLVLILMLSVALLPAFASAETAESTLYVRKVENLPEGFLFGMDVSSVLAEEKSGVKYFDFSGQESDLFRILADCGINTVRVRVWNHPYDDQGRGFGGGNCDINTAVEIGKRASACGIKLLVDFHYSDFWADPKKQMAPRAWEGMKIKEKKEALYDFTLDCMNRLKEAGIEVAMVQLGNETNGKLCGEKTWRNIAFLLQRGADAVRETYPEALIALHFANPENPDSYRTYAEKMAYYEEAGLVDYDVFATSYYPYWHGSLDNLSAILTEIAERYGKKVMVMETSYAMSGEDSDFSGNTIADGGSYEKPYPFTVQGQANCIRDITDTVVNGTPAGIGVVYWEGAWITVGGNSREENQLLWEQYGSGWASSYASVYDPEDAGKYYGGSAVDNQAFFDPQGKPLESLKVFRLMRDGNPAAVAPDALEEPMVECDLNAPLELPETVNAIMTDNSRVALPVTWNLTEEMDRTMHSSGIARYDIAGEADNRSAVCHVSMIEYNYLKNGGFEEKNDFADPEAPWRLTELGQADELWIEEKKSDSLSGTRHFHFWSAARNSIDFMLEQRLKPEELPAGKYRFSLSIMGGDSGESVIEAYVLIDGQKIASVPMTITSWNNWDTAAIEFDHPEETEVVVGIRVRCEGTGAGAWGKIDDAMLNSVR